MADTLDPALAYAAGAITILGPCVLPLVPIVLGSAAQRRRLRPLALSAGLVVSFTGVGFAVATPGAGAGLDGEAVRAFGAVMRVIVGAVLLLPVLQRASEHIAAPLSRWAGERQAKLDRFGLAGQAGIGVLLGLVWSPCVGPTLGTPTVLAAQGKNLVGVALVMTGFGGGIASVLLLLALATRGFPARWRSRMMRAGGGGRRVLGALAIAVGLLILTGGDLVFEAAVVQAAPD